MNIKYLGYFYSLLAIEIAVCNCENTTLYFSNGSAARLVCPLVNDSISWTGPPDRQLIVAGDMVYKNDFQVIKNRTHVSLEIKVFKEENEGTYVCETLETDFSFLVVMLKAPSNMIIHNETSNGCIYGYVDRDLSLTCQVTSGTPKGNVYWKRDDKVVENSHSSLVTYLFRPSASCDLEEFSCVANNSIILQRNIKICLYYPPKLQIAPVGAAVVEGTKAILTCVFSLPNEIKKTISWKYKDNNIEKWSNLKHVEIGSITRTQAGEYSCTVEHQHWTASANLTIEVLYQPNVSITYNDTNRVLKCKAAGVPNHYDFNNWKHKNEIGVLLRELPSTRNGSVSIPYIKNETDRHFDRGIYVCNVSNNVSIDGSKYVLAEYWLNSTGKPYFVTTNKATQYGILSQETSVIADIVSFTKPVDAAVFTDNMFIDSYSKNVQLRVIDTVYDHNVFVQGIRLSFTIHIQCADDFRSYTVIVNNTHGSSNYTINLSAATRPEPPFSMHCFSRENEIEINWEPGFNGGFKQQFFVQYRSRQEQSWKILNASGDQSNTTSTVVGNLEPGTEYFIRMFSKNTIDSSNYTRQCVVETETESRFGVIIVIFVILLALISMSCLLYQYKTGKIKDIRNSSCIRFIQVIREGIGGVENDMYEMQNNIQQQQQPQDDNPEIPVYSSIDRRHQLSIGSTVSYSVTKKKKPNPVWPRKEQKGDELKTTNNCEISTSNETVKQDLNYIEVCFDQKPKDYPFKIHGLEQKTDYIDIDFTKKVDKPPESDKDDISDDGFASAEVVKSMKNLQLSDF